MTFINTLSAPVSSGNAATMSSREIADICNTRHNQIVETIERLFENGVLRESRKTTRTYRPAAGGRPTDVYDLTKRDTLVVVSGYNDEVRAKIIDRWMELETQQAPALPKTYAEALLEAGRLAQERDKLAEEKKALEPKVAALDRLASLEGVHNLRSAAQQCGWPERKFINRLIELGWLYTHSVTGRKCAYADKIKAGLMESKNVEVRRTGYVEGVGQPMITQKGLAKIRTIIGDVPVDDTALPAELAQKATPRPFAHRSGATPA